MQSPFNDISGNQRSLRPVDYTQFTQLCRLSVKSWLHVCTVNICVDIDASSVNQELEVAYDSTKIDFPK